MSGFHHCYIRNQIWVTEILCSCRTDLNTSMALDTHTHNIGGIPGRYYPYRTGIYTPSAAGTKIIFRHRLCLLERSRHLVNPDGDIIGPIGFFPFYCNRLWQPGQQLQLFHHVSGKRIGLCPILCIRTSLRQYAGKCMTGNQRGTCHGMKSIFLQTVPQFLQSDIIATAGS